MDSSDKFVHDKVFEVIAGYGVQSICDYGCSEGAFDTFSERAGVVRAIGRY